VSINTPQRGRPKADRKAQQDAILKATLEVLITSGYQKTTTLTIAKTCGISKNTLYSHFPSKEALFGALIQWRVAAMNEHLVTAIDDPSLSIEQTLKRFGHDLLEIVLSDVALAIYRAAMNSATSHDLRFSKMCMKYGREPAAEKLKTVLEKARIRQELVFDDFEDAEHDLLGLLNGDINIRRLLGILPQPDETQIATIVDRAVGQFMRLYGPRDSGTSKP